MRVPKVGSSSARASALDAAASQMTASEPGAAIPASAARILGTIPPEIVPASMRASAAAAVREAIFDPSAPRIPSTSVIRISRRAPSPAASPPAASSALTLQTRPSSSRASGATTGTCPLTRMRVQQVALDPHDVGDEAEPGHALPDEQPAVDAGEAHRVDPQVAERGDELGVDDAAQDGRGNLQRLRVRDAEAALEAGRDAEPFEPLGHSLAAAVDDDDWAAPGDRGHLGQHLLLVGEVVPPSLRTRTSLTSCTPRSRSRTAR